MMKVLKTTITIKKINIDLVFCPAKKLYWEYLICKTCHCFKSNYNSYIECNFRKSEFSGSKSSNNTAESSVKGILEQNFSKNAETKNSNITAVGFESKYSNTIDVKHLQNGVYVLKVFSDKKLIGTEKFILN